jgi:hypothetical protein
MTTGDVVAIVIVSAMCTIVGLVSAFVWAQSRKSLVVTSLPSGFTESDLLSAVPGSVSVRRRKDGVSAVVEFQFSSSASDVMNRSKPETEKLQTAGVDLHFAKVSSYEMFVAMCSVSSPSVGNNALSPFSETVSSNPMGLRYAMAIGDIDDSYH